MHIQYFEEDIEFELPDKSGTTAWLNEVIKMHDHQVASLNYIFCSDEYLHNINIYYLNHDTFTDIITFDNAEEEGLIEADIFISIDRIRENQVNLNTTFDSELHRVMAHGVLHLLGFKDKTRIDKQKMREKEDACLSLRSYY